MFEINHCNADLQGPAFMLARNIKNSFWKCFRILIEFQQEEKTLELRYHA